MKLGKKQVVKDLKISFKPPQGWIKHPKDNIWRPKKDNPKVFPPTIIMQRVFGVAMNVCPDASDRLGIMPPATVNIATSPPPS